MSACVSLTGRKGETHVPARERAYTGVFSLWDNLRRIAILALSAVSRTYAPFVLMGVLNRAFPAFASVFFCYAGNKRYANHYSYPSCRNFLLWFPTVIGVFRQGRRWGLICAAPVTEAEFTDPKNARNLDRLFRRVALIKVLLGVERMSFAGILPNILRAHYPEEIGDDGDHTAEVVRKAVHDVRKKHFACSDHAVVLLGGAGRIGRVVQEGLRADGIAPVIIDPAVRARTLKDLEPKSLILVDVSRYGVIDRYICELPESTIILNEVFPEPSREAIGRLKSKNIVAYHIAGVDAEVYPPLPLGYKGAVPCCAIHSDEVGEPVLMRIA